MAKRKKTRKMWTEEEKRALIADWQATENMDLTAWAAQKGISSVWFRQRVAPLQPGLILRRHSAQPAAQAAEATAASTSPINFSTADTETKLKLVAEYAALPIGAGRHEKADWRKAHNVSQALIGYWLKKARGQKAETSLAIRNPSTTLQALVAEYTSLPRAGGQKSAWLKAHNLTHQQIFDMKNRVARGQNGLQNGATPHVPIQPIPVEPATLDEAINALRVRLDIRNEVYSEVFGILNSLRGTR